MNNKLSLGFAAAAFLALGAALFSALNLQAVDSARGAVAFVNGVSIPDAEYARALDAMQAGLQRPLTTEDRQRALTILVDEELIVQEALRLDLARDDRLTRKNLVQAMIRSSRALATGAGSSEETLKTFYEENKPLFAAPRLVTVVAGKASDDTVAADFTNALIAGSSYNEAASAAGLDRLYVPAGIPAGKVADYLGGAARDAVLTMSPGDIAGPIASDGGALFVWLQEETGGPLSFEAARESVIDEWGRRQDEAALEKYITRLRRNARIKTIVDPETTPLSQ